MRARLALALGAAALGAVVDAGPAAFGPTQVAVVPNAALQGIGALARLPCQAFQCFEQQIVDQLRRDTNSHW